MVRVKKGKINQTPGCQKSVQEAPVTLERPLIQCVSECGVSRGRRVGRREKQKHGEEAAAAAAEESAGGGQRL